jgi:hypothetical protein
MNKIILLMGLFIIFLVAIGMAPSIFGSMEESVNFTNNTMGDQINSTSDVIQTGLSVSTVILIFLVIAILIAGLMYLYRHSY